MSDRAVTPTLRADIRGHVAHVVMTRADAANTMNRQFGRDFLVIASAVRSNPDVRAVLITGEGRNFCFGGDLKEMMASGEDVGAYLTELTANVHSAIEHFVRMDAPVIAVVNGTAAGAGLGLVLAADLAIAGRSATFMPAYTGVGLTPDAGCTFWLPRAIGYKRALGWLLTNRVLDAEQALAWGLVNQVVDDDKLMQAAVTLADGLAAGPTGAFGAVKRLLAEAEPGLEGQLRRESRSIAMRAQTVEAREGISAFLQKRLPKFI